MNGYDQLKEQLTVPTVASGYGLEVGRSGMISCIFHPDKTPSMKLYNNHFHCFGCSEHGDVIALTAGLFGISRSQAYKKLVNDFKVATKPSIIKQISQNTYKLQEQRCFYLLNAYCKLMEKHRTEFAPNTDNEPLNPLFVDSLINLEKYWYYRETFLNSTKDERLAFIKSHEQELKQIERKLQPDTVAKAETTL